MNSWFFLPFPRAVFDLWNRGSGRGEEPGGAKGLRLIQIRFCDGEFGKNLGCLSTKFAANRESLIQVRRTQSAFHSAHTGSVDYRVPAVQWPFIGPKNVDSSLRLLAR